MIIYIYVLNNRVKLPFSSFRASRGYQLLVLTNNNEIAKFVGFEEKSKDQIKKFIKDYYEATFVEKEPFVKGWNWGSVDFNGKYKNCNLNCCDSKNNNVFSIIFILLI